MGQRKIFRIFLHSLNAINANGGANCSNLWFQVRLPGIMADPFKKYQWAVEQFFVMANLNNSVTTSWVINMNSFPQFDSYSTMTKSVNNCNLMTRGATNTSKNILFNSIGAPFNNTSVLENGRINISITDVSGNDKWEWNNNCNYCMMICIWEVPTYFSYIIEINYFI